MFEAFETISPFCGVSAAVVPSGSRPLAAVTPLRIEQ